MAFFELSFDCGESSLSVRRFSIHEAVSNLFTVSVWVRSADPAVDLEAVLYAPRHYVAYRASTSTNP